MERKLISIGIGTDPSFEGGLYEEINNIRRPISFWRFLRLYFKIMFHI